MGFEQKSQVPNFTQNGEPHISRAFNFSVSFYSLKVVLDNLHLDQIKLSDAFIGFIRDKQ